MFLAVSILAGVLVAGLGLPFAALAAGTTRAAATALQDVPADLAVPPQHEASNMYMADGSLLARFYDQNRQYIPLDQISPEMQMAQIAIEDHRFFEHGAIDLQSIFRAAVSNAAGGTISGGGSTLTQQYVKLVRVQLCNGEKTCEQEVQAPNMDRKILEMRYAVALEQNLTKEEILERYLNMAYYGDGAYGAQAAARHYYNIDASELNVAQAAMLAAWCRTRAPPIRCTTRRLRWQDATRCWTAGALPGDADRDRRGGQAGGLDAPGAGHPERLPGTAYPFICDYAQRVITSEQMSSLGKPSRTG